jgi:ligand-binding sensor domain-containing protein
MQSFQPNMTGDGGVCRFDGNKFSSFPEIKGLSQNDIYTIYETRAGKLWIGATHLGAYRLDGERFTLFDKTDRPHWTRNFGLQAMLEDRNGTLWCGFSGGLFRFHGDSFSNVTKDDVLSSQISQQE